MDATQHLLLLQIGPVQDFITAARTADDLWSGSYLIAYLTAAGIKYVEDHSGEIIFPSLDNQIIYKKLKNNNLPELGQPTLPNRFLALVPGAEAADIAKGAEFAIRSKLQEISKTCFDKFMELFPESGKRYQKRWDDQVNAFLQISWQTVEAGNCWGDDYKKILANLAARRNTRNFTQIPIDPEQNGCRKDALNGKDEIVGDPAEWKKVQEAKTFFAGDDKPYGAMNIIKRLWKDCFLGDCKKQNNSTYSLRKKSNGEASEYIAAIQMDGDRMGTVLSDKNKDREFFSRFSKKLANFTQKEAEKIIKAHEGILVYAGGDDVLALLPACNAVQCARELREKFCADEPDMPGSEKNLCPEADRVTLSAGISFAHWKTPLPRLVEEARRAEHRAKESYDRNALALSIVKRSGEILHWGAKFDSEAWNIFEQFSQLHRDKIVSGSFATALALYLKQYNLDEINGRDVEIFAEIIATDFGLTCERHREQEIPVFFGENAKKYINELTGQKKLADFPLLFLCANFLCRKKQEENNNHE